MSTYKIIYEVSKFLQNMLWNGYTGDQTMKQYIPSADSIVLMNPADTAKDTNRRLSLWLYQVSPNGFLRNSPMQRVPGRDDLIQFPPLSIDLCYLLTPSTGSPEGDQMVLGRAMQILNDSAVSLLTSAEAANAAEELHISMCQRSLQELAEVWEALQQPYHLSVCYEICCVRIDSTRTERAVRISDRSQNYENNPAGAPV